MSHAGDPPRKAVPAQLGFLAIYNPSLGTTDDTLENQIVYYSSTESREGATALKSHPDPKKLQDAIREQNNEQLRQIGLAQGMVEFGRSFSDGKAVDTIETEKCRIILHELESGWWILTSINLTILPTTTKSSAAKGKAAEEMETVEYSTREVKPAILLLGDLLRAHSTFLLHHASSMSALFVRTRRSKFVGILTRYWDTFLSTWNVMMHGNPANSLYGGIKIAACGELGMGVGEEERGSGEREVLEGFVGRIEGLVDVVVSKFGDGVSAEESASKAGKGKQHQPKPTRPWLGSGDDPTAEDGVIFLGTGALSRKSLRDVSHWVEDLYRWGPHAYGVIDNPTSTRRTKKSRGKAKTKARALSPEAKTGARQVYGLSIRDKPSRRSSSPRQDPKSTLPPMPVSEDGTQHTTPRSKIQRPSFHRGPSSYTSSDGESKKDSKFVQYLKLGYGTHWSLGASPMSESVVTEPQNSNPQAVEDTAGSEALAKRPKINRTASDCSLYPENDSTGHYLIGLMGNIEDYEGAESDVDRQKSPNHEDNPETSNSRLFLRTLTVELEREEDARAETDISIDLGNAENESLSSKHLGSEKTNTSNASYESQDRNKTKKLRVVVYVNRPFIFVFLFELRSDALALSTLYRSLHYQIGPLIKPLLASTSFRASRPDISDDTPDSSSPIYSLIWDPNLLTINSTIPNIPDPHQAQMNTAQIPPWTRIEGLNTHMQIINTYISSTTEKSQIERTCKTSRGWWVVYCRIPDPEPSQSETSIISGTARIPKPIAEESTDSQDTTAPSQARESRATSTFDTSINSGPAHPFLDVPSSTSDLALAAKVKEIFLIRRASDYTSSKSSTRFVSGQSLTDDSGWAAGTGRLAQGIGVDTKRYIEGLLNLNS